MNFFNRILSEPVLILEVVRQVVLWAMVMGFFTLSDNQQATTLALVSAILALLNRALVKPIIGS